MKIIQFYLLTILLLSFMVIGCGKKKNDAASAAPEERKEEALTDDGIYRAVLRPVNPSLAENSTGTVEISISGEELIVESNLIGTPSGAKHYQNIMLHHRCPDMEADINGDSFIDIVEAMNSTGPVLLPLDSDLSGQLVGIDYGPIANSAGAYVYRRSGALSETLADLQAPDPDTEDHIVKLSPGQNINLHGRAILVHGAKKGEVLPATVESAGAAPAYEMIPIACGKLIRIENESIE